MLAEFINYVNFDNRRRWRNDVISMIVAAAGVAISPWQSDHDALICGTLVLAAMMTVTTLISITSGHARALDSGRRRLAFGGAYVVVALVAIVAEELLSPELEAAVLNHRLRKLASAGLTPENIQKATKIVTEAQKHKLRSDPNLISQLGIKVLEGTENTPQPSWDAVCAFAGYRSSLIPEPALPERIVLNPAAGVDVGVTFVGPGQSGALWESPRSGIVTWPAARVINRIIHQEAGGEIFIDDSRIHNFTFVNANLLYRGGPLELEAVQFVQCHFIAISETPHARANVQRLLRSVLTGGLVTLDLK